MAIGTYAELQAAVGTWLDRTDLTAPAPTFIRLTESKINKVLRSHQMIKRVETVLDDAVETLPVDFLEMLSAHIRTSPVTPVDFRPMNDFVRLDEFNLTGTPRWYSIVGNTLRFAPAPIGSPTFEMSYYARVPALSDDEPVNWLLTDYPDVYLYGALAEASIYLREDDRAGYWGGLFGGEIANLNVASERARFSASPLAIRPSTRF